MSQTEVQLIKDAVIVNADVSNSAAIDVSKISGVMPLAGGSFTDDVTFTGASANVTFDKSSNEFLFADNAKASFGNNGDLVIKHTGSNSLIEDVGQGNLEIQTNGSILLQKGNSEFLAKFISDGAVELYHNNSKKLETTSGGIDLSDQLQVDGTVFATGGLKINSDSTKLRLGASDDLLMFHNGTDSFLQNTTGTLKISTQGGSDQVQINKGVVDEHMAKFIADGGVELYHNNIKKFETQSSGVTISGSVYIPDNEIAGFGDISAPDLRIYHAGGSPGTNIIRGNTTAPLAFWTNSNERMRIDSSGNVGIGTTSPNAFTNYTTLTINGGSDGAGIDLELNDNNIYGRFFADVTGIQIQATQSGDSIRFETGGSTVRARITDDGLCFGSDSAAANALDDYEEGTFTPAFNTTADNLTFNGGSRTNSSLYQARSGSYTKVGRRVWFQISMSTTGLTSVGGSDFIALDGLPFTAASESSTYPRFVMACQAGRFDATNTFVPLFLVLNPGTTLCQLRQSFDVQKTVSSFNVTGSGNRNVIEAFGSYEVAS